MYPSSDDYNHNPNPISLSEQILPHMPLFISETNPNSKFEELHLTSSFHFPSPFIHYEDFVNELTWQQLHDLFIQQQPFTPENSVTEIVNNMDDPKHDADVALKRGLTEKCTWMPEQNIRKRSLKKDRHSKITTAKGPRDRRMRLSLDVARKFFDLQDILGFDKASKTVEWLLIQSNSAIKEITRGLPLMKYGSASVGANTSVSSTTSECEVVSGIDDATTTNDNGQQASINMKMKVKSSCKKEKPSCKKEKKAKLARRTALHLLARESRKAARERARKRTREKSILGETKLGLESGTYGSNKINPCTNLEGLKEVEELNSQEQREYAAGDSLVITGNCNPSSICTYQQDAEISHVNQFSDFGCCGKTWEAYNNMSLGA